MLRMKKLAAGLLAFVMLLSTVPTPALATEVEAEPCQHQYESTVIAPTCTRGGHTSYRCVLCEDTYTADPTDPTGICRLEAVAEVPATCVAEGTAAHYICLDCGKKYEDAEGTKPVEDTALVLPLAACKPEAMAEVPATCVAEGTAAYYACAVCGKKYEDAEGTKPVDDAALVLPKGACQLEAVAEVPATCVDAGTAAHYRCKVCNTLYKDEAGLMPVTAAEELTIPALPHEFSEWEVVEFPGPETEGLEARNCLICDLNETRPIPALTCDLATPKVTVKLDSATNKPVLSWPAVAGAEAYLIYRAYEDEEEAELLGAVEELSVVDIYAEPGVTYWYTVMALSSTGYSEFSEFVSGMAKCLKPQVTVTSDPATGKPSLSWAEVEGAMKYEVYRSTSSSKNFKLVATVEEPAAIITSSNVGTKYYYKVKAICGNTAANSAYSAVVSHICDCAQPVITLASGASGGIKISWAKVTGAKKYQVFRASSLDGTYTRITTTSSLSFTDTKAPKNQVSYYKVRAYGANTDSLSVYSEAASLMNHTFGAWVTIVPSMPESEGFRERTCSVCGHVEGQVTAVLKRSLKTPSLSLSAGSNTGKPYLSWNKISGATKYYIYRVDPATGERTYLTETTARNYTDKDAVVGGSYSYQVVAVSSTKCSNYSKVKTVVCKCPKPVLSFTSEPVSGKPVAQWEAVEGAVKYEVYRSTSSSKNFKLVAETSDLSVMIEGSKPGSTYYYRLKAIGAAEGTASANSSTIKHVCDCAQPVAAIRSGATSGLKISWEKVAGAKKYQVFRASAEDGTYTRITTTSSLSYTDTKAPKNQVSYYKVKAYGSSTASLSAYSEVVSLMNHTYGAWVTIVPSMPESEGFRERTCTVCGHVEGEVTPVLKRSLKTPSLSLSANSTSGKPYLSWNKISGATKYYIYQVDPATGERTYLTETTKRNYTIADAVVGESYAYQVVAVSSTKCSDYSKVKTVICKCPKPVAKVVSDVVTGNPVLSWEAVDGAVKYEIYRSTSSSKNFKLVAETTELTAMVTGGSVGRTYYYRVKAIGPVEGSNSSNSANVKHICDCAQPVISLSSGSKSGIKISWEKVAGAKKYQIYRANAEDGSYTRITTTSSLSYTDTKAPKNQVSYYKVRAYGSDTNSLSAYSEVVSLMNHTFGPWTVLTPTTPEADGQEARVCTYCGETEYRVIPQLVMSLDTPTLTVSAENTSGKPVLSWNAVSKASGYLIYQVDPTTGERVLLTTTTQRTYTYEAAVPGNQYVFCVVAVNSTQCSNYSTNQMATAKCGVPQIRIKQDLETGALILTWEASEYAVGYDVYWATTLDAGYELYTSTQDLTVTVTEGTPGVPLYFKIQAIHELDAGANSVLSAGISLDGECTDLVIHAGRVSPTAAKIVWCKIKDAKTYNVYRATSLNGSYSKIATVKSAEHVDISAPEATTYYYQVKAYNSDGKLLSTSQKEAADKPCAVPVKIYISPSSQPENKYAYGSTNEAKECRKIALALAEALERCGFRAMANVDPTYEMNDRMAESNAWGANLHVPIHSNAFNGSAMGTQVYHDGVSGSNSRNAAKAIYNALAPLSPGTSGESLKKHSGLYEFNKSNNPTAYIEVAFHDTKTEAKWIINNTEKIAEAICKGICKTYGFTYIAP